MLKIQYMHVSKDICVHELRRFTTALKSVTKFVAATNSNDS